MEKSEVVNLLLTYPEVHEYETYPGTEFNPNDIPKVLRERNIKGLTFERLPFREYPPEFRPHYGEKYRPAMVKNYRSLLREGGVDGGSSSVEAFALLEKFGRGAYREMFEALFLFRVRLFWLKRRTLALKKDGTSVRLYESDPYQDRFQAYPFSVWASVATHAFGTHLTNFATKMFFGIEGYFPDWFPFFDDVDPFKEPERFAWPFSRVTPEIATLVMHMEDRLDILDLFESRGYTFYQAVDWVLNYIGHYNRIVGKRVYEFIPATPDNPAFVCFKPVVHRRLAWRLALPSSMWGRDRDWVRKMPPEDAKSKMVKKDVGARQREFTESAAATRKPVAVSSGL